MAESSVIQSNHLVEAVCKIETDYFLNTMDSNTLLHVLQEINQTYESIQESLNPDFDTKNIVSILLILERIKENLIFESSVTSMIENEFETLYFTLEKTTSSSSSDHDRSYEINDEFNNDELLIETNFDNKDDEFSSSKPKNKRSNYPKKISRILKNWLKENMNNPYPSESEKLMLIEHTGLDATQINNWFINARRRILPFMKSKYIKYD